MLTQLEVAYRTLRRKLSSSHWLMNLLKLSQHGRSTTLDQSNPVSSEHVGLILVQIDGLGLAELEKAIGSGEAPFLESLLKREHYRCHSMYSGLPSSTPAVQGELFYGVKTIVPAFGFKPYNSSETARMFDPETAKRVQNELEDGHPPLLAGGSAYCNIYTGGAKEAHYCASSLGWDDVLNNIKPVHWVVACLLNLPMVVRTLFSVILEIFIALFDFLRGQLNGRMLYPELKFIAARVGISIFLRDIVTQSACVDIARGLPVVQLNYLGYDEQSHRRGPDSAFAHWSIKGIDRCIKKLWNCAHSTDTRHYDLWVYSDHGQETTIPYIKKAGVSINDAVTTAFSHLTTSPKREAILCEHKEPHQHHEVKPAEYKSPHQKFGTLNQEHGIQYQRAQLLGGKYLQKLFAPAFSTSEPIENSDHLSIPQVIAIGPVGHVYMKPGHDDYDLQCSLAKRLVSDHGVPATAMIKPDNRLSVFTKSGVHDAGRDADELFGVNHPYKHVIAEDLHNLCSHPDAGQVVLLGWIDGEQAVSFPNENGSHAGLGPKETQAFALLPGDVSVNESEFGCFRPLSLRQAARQHLYEKSTSWPNDQHLLNDESDGDTLRIMTYNVHSCVGMDGVVSVNRIARVIARYRPDVIALQELDVGKKRTHYLHQAEKLAEQLKMDFHFYPAIVAENERYGDAILSRLPMQVVKSCALRKFGSKKLEPRGAQWASIEFNGSTIQFLNTHLGLNAEERRAHVDELMSDQWLGHESFSGPGIVCGDLNAIPGSYVIKSLTKNFDDAQESVTGQKNCNTFSTRVPALRIDHILTNPFFEVLSVEVPSTQLTRIASDHLPLIATVKLKGL